VQLFRNGCLEYGDAYVLNSGNKWGRPGDIPSKVFEESLVATSGNAVLVLNRLGIEDPVYMSCTLIGVKGYALSRDGVTFYETNASHKFDRSVIQTQDLEINRAEPTPYPKSLLPIVDSIWQANGYEETPWLRNWGLDRNRRPISRE
jgi:hypothetical protein